MHTVAVKSVTAGPVEKTYDFEVANRHRFYANGVLAHNCMKHYHPHGDKSIFDAYVVMFHSLVPLIDASGNWGTLSDMTPAAMRYVEMRMSAYSESVFFDRFYTPTIKFVPTYNGAKEEPVVLPALLPNLVFNGTLGIGVGVRTEIPCYDPRSVIRVLLRGLENDGVVTPAMCKKLEFISLFGGTPVLDDADADIKSLYSKGKGSITYTSPFSLNRKAKKITIEKFAPFASLPAQLTKVMDDDRILSANDVSDVHDKYGKVEIVFKRSVAESEVGKEARKIIDKYFSARENYDIKVTERFLEEGKDEPTVSLKSSTIPMVLTEWIKHRLALEVEACTYWIDRRKEDIARLELFLLAFKWRDYIIACLKKKGITDKELDEMVAKKLKITVEQAKIILDMKIRQLKSLEAETMRAEIVNLQNEIRGYKKRIKNPAEYVMEHIRTLGKKLFPKGE